jgi:hypothetical protein
MIAIATEIDPEVARVAFACFVSGYILGSLQDLAWKGLRRGRR